MKKITIIAIVLLTIFNYGFTQGGGESPNPGNSLKIGIGTTFLKPANYLASNTLHLQYERTLFKPIRLTLDGFKIDGSQTKSDGHEHSSKGYQADASLNLALFSNSSNALKIGGGGTWQNMSYRYTTSVEQDSNGQVISKLFEEDQAQNFGWVVSMEYEVYVVKHIVLGTQLTYKKYENGDQNYFFGLNAGFRF